MELVKTMLEPPISRNSQGEGVLNTISCHLSLARTGLSGYLGELPVYATFRATWVVRAIHPEAAAVFVVVFRFFFCVSVAAEAVSWRDVQVHECCR